MIVTTERSVAELLRTKENQVVHSPDQVTTLEQLTPGQLFVVKAVSGTSAEAYQDTKVIIPLNRPVRSFWGIWGDVCVEAISVKGRPSAPKGRYLTWGGVDLSEVGVVPDVYTGGRWHTDYWLEPACEIEGDILERIAETSLYPSLQNNRNALSKIGQVRAFLAWECTRTTAKISLKPSDSTQDLDWQLLSVAVPVETFGQKIAARRYFQRIAENPAYPYSQAQAISNAIAVLDREIARPR